ncbi:MAG: hypothetical protein ABI792_00330 [bacterium]
MRRYKINSQAPKESPKDQEIAKDKKKKDDDNIVDAKFEEIK